MSQKKKKKNGAVPAVRRFVEITRNQSLGIEVTTGQAWAGIDQQVGHGSADALFALTDEQYTAALTNGWLEQPLLADCWRGAHPELLLFHPGGNSWHPERWFPYRTRMLSPRFAGEVWRHIDALGEPADGERVEISRSLAAGTAAIQLGPDGVSGMTFRLVGDERYPRPAALIAGLTAGSDREQTRALLGDPVEMYSDEFLIEGVRVRLDYVDDGLVEIALERPDSLQAPSGQIGLFLSVIGEPELGPAFQAAARLSGEHSRRWAASSGVVRRLIAFDGGVEMQVQDDRVLSVHIRLRSATDSVYRHADDLIPGVTWPASREQLHAALGAPVASNGGTDMHRYGRLDLMIDYVAGANGQAPSGMTAVLGGTSVSSRFYRWRSGDFTLFLDALGRVPSNALVEHVRSLPGVRLRMSSGVVTEVEIGTSGYQTERFAAFVDGMPGEPTCKDVPFAGTSYSGRYDGLQYMEQGWIHVRSPDGTMVTSISVSQEEPRDVVVHQLMPHRDR